MLDNIKLIQSITEQQYIQLLNTLRLLNPVSHTKFENTGITVTQTTYKDCFLKLTPNYLTVSLSLSKLLLGTNQFNVTRKDAALALLKLQDILGIDISSAKVSRIDIAYNISMDQPLETYFKLLCSKDKMKRWTISNETLYFTNKNKGMKLVFYNKTNQLSDTKQVVLPENLTKNILRYEISLTSKVIKKLGYHEITCATLIDEAFYQSLVELWYNEYKTIIKLSYSEATNYGNNLSEFKEYLMMAGIEKIGATAVYDIVDNHPAFKLSPKTKYNIKRMLKKLITNRVNFNASDALDELDEKMFNILQNAA